MFYNLISTPLGSNGQDSVLGQLGFDRLRVGAVRNGKGLGELPRRHHGPSKVYQINFSALVQLLSS